MAYGDYSVRQLVKSLSAKDIVNHAELLDGHELLVVVYGDTRAYMSPVLKAVERVVSDGDNVKVVVVFIYSEHTALVHRFIEGGVDVYILRH